MKAAAIPLRASRAVRALAYVAIFIPKKPDTMDETAPIRKAMVEKRPLYRAGALLMPPSSCHLVEKPSWELSKTKMMTEKKACSAGQQALTGSKDSKVLNPRYNKPTFQLNQVCTLLVSQAVR